MGPSEGSTHTRRGKHLNWQERIQIETLKKAGHSSSEIADLIGCSVRTIQRELKRGLVEHLNSDLTTTWKYNANRAQDVHEENVSTRGPLVKLKAGSAAEAFIRHYLLRQKWSPEAIAARMRAKGMCNAVCARTIYTYVDNGWISGVTNESLWEKRLRGKKHKSLHRRAKRANAPGHGINDRPEVVDKREELGHWEIDLVVGGTGKGQAALMTLSERMSRKVIIRKISNKTQRAVIRAINGIERKLGSEEFKSLFKSITADNGSEFLDFKSLERSVYGKKRRTHIYYAHPYSSWERGSNENVNRIIRRFIPKGSDISTFTQAKIRKLETWINNYPRKILGFKTAEDVFMEKRVA